MANNFNDNANKKNLNGSDISYTTYRTNYPNDEAMKENGGVPSSGSDVNLEDNKTATIDVSTYTEPIEIEPTQGKDGMEKVTVTLSNIPSGGTAYAWEYQDGVQYFNFSEAPDILSGDERVLIPNISLNLLSLRVGSIPSGVSYEKTASSNFTLDGVIFTRDSTKDFILWQVS